MLHTHDLSVDDLTYRCMWSKRVIDDCDRYKSANCPMEERDSEIRADERRKFAEWFAKSSKVSESVLEHIVNRWIEDYEKEQKNEQKQHKALS